MVSVSIPMPGMIVGESERSSPAAGPAALGVYRTLIVSVPCTRAACRAERVTVWVLMMAERAVASPAL